MGKVDELFGEGTADNVMMVYAEYVPHDNIVACRRVSDDKIVVKVTQGEMLFYDTDGEVIYELANDGSDGTGEEDTRIDLMLDLAWGEDFHTHVMVTLDAVAAFADLINSAVDDD